MSNRHRPIVTARPMKSSVLYSQSHCNRQMKLNVLYIIITIVTDQRNQLSYNYRPIVIVLWNFKSNNHGPIITDQRNQVCYNQPIETDQRN